MRFGMRLIVLGIASFGSLLLAQAPASEPEPMQLTLSFYNEKMRQSGQPSTLKYGEGIVLVELKWKPAFKEADDVYYVAWVRGEDNDWASANAVKGKDELGQVGCRQYAYLGRLRTGASTGTRIKMQFGYRPEGISSFPTGNAANNGLVPLPEAMPLQPGTYKLTACVQRVGPAGVTDSATVPFSITVGPDAGTPVVYGIADQQVFQRSSKSGGDIAFRLVAPKGPWKAKLSKAGQAPLSASGSSPNVEIANVPVGGPYQVELTASGKTRTFSNIYVGDLWIISGQSNAVGTGNDAALGAKSMPGVQCLDPRYGLLEWTPARDGLFQQTVGPWVTAAQEFYVQTKVPVGLIGHAVGSKSIDYFLDGNRMDPYFLRPLVERNGVGAAAFFWYQGESDSFQPENEKAYLAKLRSLVGSMRGLTRNPQLMVGICQLGRYLWFKDGHFAAVREAQRQFVLSDSHSALYATIPYEVNAKDKIHLETPGYIALGKQIAAQMIDLERTGQVQSPGPVLSDARFTGADRKQIVATFTNGRGLKGNASADEWFVKDDTHRGFKDGGFVEIETITVDAQKQQVLIGLKSPVKGSVTLSYGYRSDVGGTLTNGKGLPAAAFVDVPLNK